MIKTKRKNLFQNINLIMIAFVLFMISGCAEKDGEVSASPSQSTESSQYVDVLSEKWMVPAKEQDKTVDWDIVQYVPGIATPADSKRVLLMNNTVCARNGIFSLLSQQEGTDEEEVISRYELRYTDLNSMEIKSLWQSISDLDFNGIWDEAYVLQVEEKLKQGMGSVLSIDTDNENIFIFLNVCDTKGKITNLYKIVTDRTGSVSEITDYIDFYNETVGKNEVFYVPEIISGKDGEVFYTDRFNKVMYLIDKTGKEYIAIDARDFIRTYKCIGKNVDGVPVFSYSRSPEETVFFYIDEDGKHDLVCCGIDQGLYFLDEFGSMLILSGSRLLSWNIATGEKDVLYDFVNLDTFQCIGIGRNDAGEVSVCFQSGADAFLYRLNDKDHPEKKELVLLQIFPDPYTRDCAADYSRSHPNVEIRVEEIDSNDDYSWQKVLNSIKKGEGPDLIFTDRKQLSILKEAGVLYPLDDLIPDEIKENMFKGALKIGEFDSGLYAISGEVYFDTYMVNDVYWSKTGWTLDEMLTKYKELQKENPDLRLFGFNYGISAYKMLAYLCASIVERTEFVDMESKTCNFETESFYELLRICRDNADKNVEQRVIIPQEEYRKMFVNEDAMVLPLSGSLLDFSRERKALGDDYHVVGAPSKNRSEGSTGTANGIAVNALSENIEEAANFVASLVSEEYQVKHTTLWVRKDIIKSHVVDAYITHEHTNTGVVNVLKPAFVIAENIGCIPLEGRKDGSSYADEYIAMMDASEPDSIEYEIKEIVLEESNAFFAGQKTEEEVAKIIQSRVQIYLDERK